MMRIKNMILAAVLGAAAVYVFAGCGEPAEKPLPAKTPVVIESIPSGATISYGGKELGKTPKSFKADRRSYMLKLAAPGFEPEYVKFTASGDETMKVNVKLKPLTGSVLIGSVPAGAQVIMNGKVMGTTPYAAGNLPCGAYSAQIRKSGYAERNASWDIRDARPVKVSINLESNVGSLVIKSEPANANVFLNDRVVGVTPYQSEVEEGVYKVRLELADHVIYNGAVTVHRDKGSEISHNFSKLPGGLNITSKPAGAVAYVDGREVGKTPVKIDNLVAGREYAVKVAKSNFGEETRTVKVSPGVISDVNVDMSINTGGIDLVVGPPGVTVYLDNEKIGVGEVDPDGSVLLSKVIELRDLLPGPHQITVAHKRGLPDRKTVEVKVLRGEIVRPENVTLWIPNAEIYYKDGQACTGIIYGEDPDKGVWFEDVRSRGARGYINRSLIREIRKLDINE